MKLARAVALLLGLAAPVALAGACGARSGLFPYYGVDAAPPEDASIDVVLPGIDAQPIDVVAPTSCAEAGDTLVYAVTTDTSSTGATNFRLLRFDPGASTFTLIGPLVCPDEGQPFSMAVDRAGAAYVLYYDEILAGEGDVTPPGNIYKVDLNTAACAPTAYVPNEAFQNFGMAFATDDTGGGETLYVASNNNLTTDSQLGAINETTLALTTVGTFTPTVTAAELTGTGDGRLFAFWAPNGPSDAGAVISQIDKTTAQVIAQSPLPTVTQGGGWAFGFWGGNFYLFTNPDGAINGDPTTIVQRYNPTTGEVVQVASYPQTIVGAGVSTCAPVN